jgi:hypothetical protein
LDKDRKRGIRRAQHKRVIAHVEKYINRRLDELHTDIANQRYKFMLKPGYLEKEILRLNQEYRRNEGRWILSREFHSWEEGYDDLSRLFRFRKQIESLDQELEEYGSNQSYTYSFFQYRRCGIRRKGQYFTNQVQ